MTRVGLVASGFRRHRLRLVLTGLSIVVAFLLFSYLVAIRKAFQMGVDAVAVAKPFDAPLTRLTAYPKANGGAPSAVPHAIHRSCRLAVMVVT